jgi:hypothetical protein
MIQRDIDYRNQLKLRSHSNNYLERMNKNKEKYAVLNIIVKDDMKINNEIIKDRIADL